MEGVVVVPLQWGHGDEAVEEIIRSRELHRSMMLQWGHGDEAVEEPDVQGVRAALCRLQWGHGDEAVEEKAESLRLYAAKQASMGPRR